MTHAKKDFYWCPNAEQANVDKTYNDTVYGLCSDFVEPADNSCDDHFFPVGELCIRVSTLPKTLAGARAHCKADNADLAFITDADSQADIATLIKAKKIRYPHYGPVQAMWVGAQYMNGEWSWLSTTAHFNAYTKWTDNTPGSGCVGACVNEGLAVSVGDNYHWKAKDPTEVLPYICITRCKKHFTWFPRLRRCLKVKESGTYNEKSL